MTYRVGLDAHMVGSRETGNETYVVGLSEGLAAVADPNLELYFYHSGSSPDSGTDHAHLQRLSTGSSWIRLGAELPLRSWADRLDLLHMTYSAPIWARCPVVLTVHDISFAEHPEWFSARDLRVLSRTVPWSIWRARRVITVSEVCRRQIIERYQLAEDKIARIYNGPGPAGRPIAEAEARTLVAGLGLDPDRCLVLAVGNLQPRKNLIRLIEAFGRVSREGIDADLLIVGPEHYRANLVHEAAAGLGGRIHFTGYLSDRQLAACYACATVFTFPSLFEGFGLPALEAMCHGTPVVCSKAGALPEVCGEAALYFDPVDTDSMASALKKALTDRDLRMRLAQAGRSRQAQFTWLGAAQSTLEIYLQAMGRLSDTTPVV